MLASEGSGNRLLRSQWHVVDQATIDRFADVTGDHQFIHVDRVRAKESGFGSTIAHGFLALSLVPALFYEATAGSEPAAVTINYGLDRLRFTSPIPSDCRIRARFDLVNATARSPTETLLRYAVTIEVEDRDKPAMVADWLIVHREMDGGGGRPALA
jgi:acyl dehydratase